MQLEQVQLDTLQIEPIGGTIGAIIRRLDLDDITDETAAVLNDALHRHGVLFYRPGADAEVTGLQFIALAEAIGEILVYPYRPKDAPVDDERISYIDDTDSKATKNFKTNVWHTDGTPEEYPPQAALLNPIIVPDRGGDTMWASMYAAYEALSPTYQQFLDGLEALHSTEQLARRMGPGGKDIFGDGTQQVHPVVLTDPVTGRRMLYVNEDYTERLVGLSDSESASVLEMLYEHIKTPEFHIRWRWQPNDIAIWEERVTQHRAVADFEGHRLLRRVAIKGTRPR